MKILIPMAGQGKRFIRAGYTTPKPLIEVDGVPMIEHIVRNFSERDQFVFGVNQEHLAANELENILKKVAPQSAIVPMPYQPEGPTATVRRMLEHVRDDEPVVVNYCDFSWVWDYEDFKQQMKKSDCDGAVICYRGFQPHLLGPNLYATLDAEGLWMKAIREKHSWHKTKQEDWTSSGTYYFKKGAHVKKYFTRIQERMELKIKNEFYVSQIFQLMKEDGLRIFIYEIPFMLQWGTPEDLEQYHYWSEYFRNQRKYQNGITENLTALILMAGAGKRFQEEGYALPKPFIPVDDQPMIVRSTASLPHASKYIFVTRDSVSQNAKDLWLKNFQPTEIVRIPELTEGQACSALAAKDKLDPEKPLLIGACDHSVLFDRQHFHEITSQTPPDALIFTYRRNPVVRYRPERYGWVKTDGKDRALQVSVKVPLEGDPAKNHAIVGAFWFKKARFFTDHAEKMIRDNSRINNEFYIDQCMNYLIEAKLDVRVFEVDYHACFGTPDELKTYQYWQRFFDLPSASKSSGSRRAGASHV